MVRFRWRGGAGGLEVGTALFAKRLTAVSGDIAGGHGDRVCSVLWALPRASAIGSRVGAVVYIARMLLCVAVQTPMGGNIERYGAARGAAVAGRLAGKARPAHGGRSADGTHAGGGGDAEAIAVVAVCGDGVDRVGRLRDEGGRGFAGDARVGEPATALVSRTGPHTVHTIATHTATPTAIGFAYAVRLRAPRPRRPPRRARACRSSPASPHSSSGPASSTP